MTIREISIRKLELLAKGMPDGKEVFENVRANIKELFGDVDRLEAGNVVRLRDERYGQSSKQVPGVRRLLDVVIEHLAPPVETEQKPATSEAASACGEPARVADLPADTGEPPTAETLTDRATALLKNLSGAAGVATKTASRVSKLSAAAYSRPPKVLAVRGQGGELPPIFITDLRWLEDGQIVRSTSGRCLYDVDAMTGEIVRELQLDDSEGWSKLLSEDGAYVFSAERDRSGRDATELFLWDAETGGQAEAGEQTSTDEPKAADTLAFMTKRPGPMWLSADASRGLSIEAAPAIGVEVIEDATVHMFDRRRGLVKHEKVPAQRVGISGDGSRVLATGWQSSGNCSVPGSKKVRLYASGAGKLTELALQDAALPEEHDTKIHGFSENGAFMAVRVDYEGMRIWDTKTGRVRRVATKDWYSPGIAAISNDGKILADIQNGGCVQLYDVEKGTPLGGPISVGSIKPQELSFSPDHSRLFVRTHTNEHRVIVFGE